MFNKYLTTLQLTHSMAITRRIYYTFVNIIYSLSFDGYAICYVLTVYMR